MIKLTKHESLLLLACKGWDLTEFIEHPLENEDTLLKSTNVTFKPMHLMMSDYWSLVEYYCIVYGTYLTCDLYTVITRDLLELVTKLRPAYVNECVLNSIDLTKQTILPEHNHLFQLLRNQISTGTNRDDYELCKEQLPTKFIDKYMKDKPWYETFDKQIAITPISDWNVDKQPVVVVHYYKAEENAVYDIRDKKYYISGWKPASNKQIASLLYTLTKDK